MFTFKSTSLEVLFCFYFISSKIEHHAVTLTLDELKNDYGIKVSFVKLDKDGEVDYGDLEDILKKSGAFEVKYS